MTLTSRQRLIVFIVVAFIIDYKPLLNLPFLWSETFFHEISHGLAALLTGGTIHNIALNFNGSGVCTTNIIGHPYKYIPQLTSRISNINTN